MKNLSKLHREEHFEKTDKTAKLATFYKNENFNLVYII